MFKYVVKRVIAAIITLWALVTIVFFLVRLMPGDPAVFHLPGELAAWQFRLLYEVHQ